MRVLILVVMASLGLVDTAAADDIDVVAGPRNSSANLSGKAVDSHAGNPRSSPVASNSTKNEPVQCHVAWDDDLEDWRCGRYVEPDKDAGDSRDDLGDIRRAIREVPMPASKLQIQPDGETLVNVDTIFYTDPTTLNRTVNLLGHSVRLEATPVRYTWVHGDGTTASTGRPGRPYPAKDVTHQYEQPGENLRARVDTAYRVRYSVDGGGWATLDETLTAPGPTTTLDVDEAAPVLTR